MHFFNFKKIFFLKKFNNILIQFLIEKFLPNYLKINKINNNVIINF